MCSLCGHRMLNKKWMQLYLPLYRLWSQWQAFSYVPVNHCLWDKNQLIIKLHPTFQRDFHATEKKNLLWDFTRDLKIHQLFISTFLAVIQNIFHFYDTTIVTIPSTWLNRGLLELEWKKKYSNPCINMVRRRSSITAADRLGCICVPHAPYPFSHFISTKAQSTWCLCAGMEVHNLS